MKNKIRDFIGLGLAVIYLGLLINSLIFLWRGAWVILKWEGNIFTDSWTWNIGLLTFILVVCGMSYYGKDIFSKSMLNFFDKIMGEKPSYSIKVKIKEK